jgi:hypothetical protein
MMCVARYENMGKVGYRELIEAAAEVYRGTELRENDVRPGGLGQAIRLELAAWRSTARPEYLERARALGELAARTFWTGKSPLPRTAAGAPADGGLYDAASGIDTLALALVELHLSILHITAVDCAPNTIDR